METTNQTTATANSFDPTNIPVQQTVTTPEALTMSLGQILSKVDTSAVIVSKYDPTVHFVCFKTFNNTLTAVELKKFFESKGIDYTNTSFNEPIVVEGHSIWMSSKASVSKDQKTIIKNLCITM